MYEADISPICSVPTVCDLNRKFQHYSDQLEKINDELTEKQNRFGHFYCRRIIGGN